MRAVARTAVICRLTTACLVVTILTLVATMSVETAAAARSRQSQVRLSAEQAAFLADVTALARRSQRRYGVPASVTIAQAILESGWGRSTLVRTAHNYFGMTCVRGDNGPFTADCRTGPDRVCDSRGCRSTTANFRTYRSVSDSFADHGRLFASNPRYARAYAHRGDANRFVAEVHRAGYATDPSYPRQLRKIMTRYNLYRYNR
jgi:flagellar protein FlgJ